jgi:YidC/Oxa1 family membrane protein insertase
LAEFSNPNQQGGQDNRSLMAMMVVLVAVFFGLQFYKAKVAPQPAAPVAPVAAPQTAMAPAGAGAPASAAQTAPLAADASKATTPAAPVVEAAGETVTVVENELYRIQFSNRGADVTSWILKQYKDAEGKPLDLVHDQAAKDFGYPMSLYTYDPALTAGLDKALFVASATGPLVASTRRMCCMPMLR